jgi:hypothetical protein
MRNILFQHILVSPRLESCNPIELIECRKEVNRERERSERVIEREKCQGEK